MITMTRRLLFSAAVADWLPALSQAENTEIFGANAGPEPYGYNYTLDVSVVGDIDARTGVLVNIKDIDKIVKDKIVQVLNRKFINQRVARFETQPPTLENMALFIADELQGSMPASVKLSALRLEDTPTRYVQWQAVAQDKSRAFGIKNGIRQGETQIESEQEAQGERKETAAMLLTRVYEFAASHRLHSPHLSDEENRELFGKCNYDNGHGHNYEVEVTVAGPVDARSGRVMEPEELDSIAHREVIDRYDHRHFNHDIPEFAGLVPSAEVITRVIWERLAPHFNGTARLYRVLVRETPRNIFEYFGEGDAKAGPDL